MNRARDRESLPEPTEAAALASLARLVGDDEAEVIWARARAETGLPEDGRLGLADLRKLAEWLAGQPGLIGVTGAALVTRVDAYRQNLHAGRR